MPETLLKDFDTNKTDMDGFLEYLAKAQYMQKVWKDIIQVAVREKKKE